MGYMHPGYAKTLSQFGEVAELPRSQGWFLKRPISGSDAFDGMGCYPYLTCRDWSQLASDLEAWGGDLVSFAAVPDPFGDYTRLDLQRAFPDRVVHFKDHYIADLTLPREQVISRHHRKGVRKALKHVDVEFIAHPLQVLEKFTELFNISILKFNIKGIKAYSRDALSRQFALPGTFMSIARYGGEIVAAHIYMLHNDVAYAHLAAADETANRVGAAYALYYRDMEFFADKVRWIDWGGEAGLARDGSLCSFKRGWATGTRPVYFCGRIFDHGRYDEIVRGRDPRQTAYFPAYREGEFT
jgi:hypothetical protein